MLNQAKDKHDCVCFRECTSECRECKTQEVEEFWCRVPGSIRKLLKDGKSGDVRCECSGGQRRKRKIMSRWEVAEIKNMESASLECVQREIAVLDEHSFEHKMVQLQTLL